MPKLMDTTMQEVKTASNYKFSAVKIDELGATEYTLATVVVDVSGSVASYQKELESCLKTVLGSCKKSPRAENLMLRLVTFNEGLTEVHGFKLLNTMKESDYNGIIQPSGNTALFDAVYASVEATKDYGKILADQEYLANAIIFIITDGCDNSSGFSADGVKNMVAKAMKTECLESITVVLVGVGYSDPSVATYLDGFKNDAGITQFINIGDATTGKLAKLANFVSKSISSTSQALGSGSASQPLTF